MSLLLEAGHLDARDYPIAVVWSEARIVRQRFSLRRREQAVVQQMVVASVFDKKSSKRLNKLLRRLERDD